MAHWAFKTTFTAVAGDQSFSSRSSARAEEVLARGNCLAEVAGDAVGGVEEPAHIGKVDAEVGEHAGVLRALAREEEGQASGAGVIERLVPEIDAAGVADRTAGGVAQSAASTAVRRSDSSASEEATIPAGRRRAGAARRCSACRRRP